MNLFSIIKYSYKSTYNYESNGSKVLGIKYFDFFGTILIYPIIVIFLIYSDVKNSSYESIATFFLFFPIGILIFNYYFVFYFQFPKTITGNRFLAQFPVSKQFCKISEFVCLALSPSILVFLSSAISFHIFDFRNLDLNTWHAVLILLLGYVLSTLITLLFFKPHPKDKSVTQFNWKLFLKERIFILIVIVLYVINYNTKTIELQSMLINFQSNYHIYELILFIISLLAGLAFYIKK